MHCNKLRAAVVLGLLACASAQAQVADPAKFFSREPDYAQPTMSPTGDYVAVDTPDGQNRALALIKITGEPQRNLFRFYGSTDRWDRPVIKEPYSATWSGDDRIIVFEGYDYGRGGSKFASGNVYSTSADAKNQAHLFGYEPDDGNQRSRLKDQGAVYLMQLMPELNGQALFYYMPFTQQASQNRTSVFHVDTNNGKREMVETFNDDVRLTADNAGRARFNYREDLDGNQIAQYRPTPDSEWKPMPASLQGQTMQVWFFEPDNNIAYAEVSEHGEPAQLYKVNFSAGTRERAGGQPNQEITGFERAGRLGPPVVLTYNAGKPKVDYLDPASPWAQLHAGLMKAFPGQMVNFIDLTRDEGKLLFSTWSDRNPGTYYVMDLKTKSPRQLFKAYEDMDPAQLSPMMPLEFKDRAGTSINAFLTIPQGKPGAHAMIVMPHGGPFGPYDTWGYNRDAQFLASLGYAVLQVNYRGSGGRGEGFEESGYKGWGTTIQEDIADGVKYAIAQGLADKDKVCIYGGSFGGYAAMMNPILNPGMYKCAIGYAGVYDIKADSAMKDASKQIRSYWSRTRGDEAIQTEQSPLTHLAKLDVPILLIHGKSDHNVDFDQFQAAEAALRRSGKTYEVFVKADEGHGFYKAADVEAAYNRMKDFLLKYNPPN